jgi:hypothetical protein
MRLLLAIFFAVLGALLFMGALGSDSTDRQFVAIAASIGCFACVALAKNHYPVVQGVMFAILDANAISHFGNSLGYCTRDYGNSVLGLPGPCVPI